MKECSKCEEFKPCKFVEDIQSILNIRYHFSFFRSSLNNDRIRYGEFICKDCDTKGLKWE